MKKEMRRCRHCGCSFQVCNKVKKHYDAGEITRDKLLSWDDQRLERWLIEKGEIESVLVSPDDLEWFRFKAVEETQKFIAKKKASFSHSEYVRPFKTGLDWLVKNGGRLVPLKSVLPKRKIKQLEYLSSKYQGWYVHCFRESI